MRALVLYDRGGCGAGALARVIADGLPSGLQARALSFDDATGADLAAAELVVLGGAAPRMRAFFARTDRGAWRDRHVAVYEVAADAAARPGGVASRLVLAWLRHHHVARPIPRTSFLPPTADGTLVASEPTRAASWARSLPIAAHLHQPFDG